MTVKDWRGVEAGNPVSKVTPPSSLGSNVFFSAASGSDRCRVVWSQDRGKTREEGLIKLLTKQAYSHPPYVIGEASRCTNAIANLDERAGDVQTAAPNTHTHTPVGQQTKPVPSQLG